MAELLHAALPVVPLDKGVSSANTGNAFLDLLPLLSVAPCALTLQLQWKYGRRLDCFVFSIGFALAVIYHYLHLHPEGIAAAQLLGLPGPTWRGLDILCAQALIARTVGHVLNVQSTVGKVISNLAFPVANLTYAHLLADGVLTLAFASKVLLVVLLATVAAKAVLEGWSTLPKYCSRRGPQTVACFALGFAFFPLPELLPRHYWLFHTLWHIFLARGYQLLYQQLEGLPDGQQQLDGADAFSPVRRPTKEGTKPRHAAAVATAASGWVQSLLQPYRRFLQYQHQHLDTLLSSKAE